MAGDNSTIMSNPLFNAVGAALGVGGLLEGGSGEGAAPPAAPQGPKIPPPKMPTAKTEGSSTPREFRQHAPVARMPQTPGRAGAPSAVDQNLPATMDPRVLMHPLVQQLLAQYGVSNQQATDTAQTADPNLFIGPEFMAQHSKLGPLLERSLEGAAFTKPSDTIGEGINNFAQGILEARAARANKYNNQLLMPFAQAQQVANLKSIADEQNFKQAQAKHYQDLEDHYTAMDDNRAQLTQLRGQQAQDANSIKKLTVVQKYQHDFGNVGANQDERDAWEKVWSDADNDPSKVDEAKLGSIIAGAQERRKNETEAQRLKRTQIMGGIKIKTTQMTQDTKTQGKGNEVNKAAYKTAADAEKAFLKDLNGGVATDANGNMVVRGTDEAKAEAQRLHQATEDARAKWEKDQTMALPGSNMTAPKASPKAGAKKNPRFDPVSGQIVYN